MSSGVDEAGPSHWTCVSGRMVCFPTRAGTETSARGNGSLNLIGG